MQLYDTRVLSYSSSRSSATASELRDDERRDVQMSENKEKEVQSHCGRTVNKSVNRSCQKRLHPKQKNVSENSTLNWKSYIDMQAVQAGLVFHDSNKMDALYLFS